MKQYSTFIFESYDINPNTGRVQLRYSLDGELELTEVLTLPLEDVNMNNIDQEQLDKALFALHLIGGISYYKTCLPKTIHIKSGTLAKRQARFWNTVYENGLGEFFYRNNIDYKNLIHFPHATERRSQEPEVKKAKPVHVKSNRVLVPFGGGKDSLVTLELLRGKPDQHVTLMRMSEHPIIDDLAHIAGLPLLNINRQLAPALFELNKDGALNGHVPITGYLSFLSVLVGLLSGYDAVVMSNEGSATEGNVEYLGREINHQWSKSIEFESLFRDYVEKWVTPHVEYFSLLRPMSELKVTEIFSQFPKYFDHFTSCNTNWKILETQRPGSHALAEKRSLWCRQCPKCAFVFCLLAAFLPKTRLTTIFGGDLFADQSLLPLYRELLGLQNHKPFECVGTADETKAAFLLAYRRGDFATSAAMKMFEADVLPTITHPETLLKQTLTLGMDHCIPREFSSLLFAR